MSATASVQTSAAASVTPGATPSKRPLAGLLGIFIAAMMAGLNNRVGGLALADVRGVLGAGFDDASWLTTVYNAGELIAMPFSAWFAITLSVRRFELWMLGTCALLAAVLPFLHDLALLLPLRFVQGLASGTLIPVLMMAALKFLPPSIRLHGLALYAMTATFAPNVSIWLAGYWVDGIDGWRWVYWQIIPLAGVAALLVGWGLPREPVQSSRFRQANWPGLACGSAALALLAIVLDRGVRLDWLHSRLITWALCTGPVLLGIYLLTEWHHPSPFIKLQVLGKRNLLLGFALFVLLLVVLISSALLPASYLGAVQDYRPLQMASIGLDVALPQLVLGFAVALLLYQRWVDARLVFAAGLLLIALACYCGAQLTAEWNREQFGTAQMLQALGQPMAVISMLFLITSVVQPQEGPYVSGAINTLRVFGSMTGAAVAAQLINIRGRLHAELLLDHAALAGNVFSLPLDVAQLGGAISQQSLVLAVADAYRWLGVLALLLIPLVLQFTYIPAPPVNTVPRRSPHPSSSHG